MQISATSNGNVVAGNTIGLNAAGVALANGTGVLIDSGSSNNTIGGAAPGAGNVISGNTGDGVDITGSGTTGNVVEGNIIGRNAAGSSVLLNGGYAVAIEAGAQAAVSGFVTGNVLNDGVLSLQGLGFLNITGNYTQTANGSLVLDLGGTDPGTFDQLNVSGTVTLDGDLTAHLVGSFTPTVGESDTVITFLARLPASSRSSTLHNPGNGDLLTSSLTPTSLVVKAVPSDLVLAGQSSANATVGGMITHP